VRLDPLIGHPTCDLDLQRRIREARKDAVIRSLRDGRRTLLDRVLRRRPAPAIDLDVRSLRDQGDDVWKSLRF
jgi:hypothetical protein